MKAYYERRAAEYDDWWGMLCENHREEVDELVTVVRSLPPVRTLDVACGTGFLTQHLPGEITALDQSEAMLDMARDRLPAVHIVRGDGIGLDFGDDSFDRVFTSFFYGHLDARERVRFLREARRVGRELVIVDAALREGVVPEQMRQRVLSDGSRWTVFKRYFTAATLLTELGGGRTLHDGRWFIAVAA